MKHLLTKPTIILVIVCSSVFPSIALAQQWAELHNSMIDIEYVVPTLPKNFPTYVAFRDYRALDELSAFLSPLRLPRRLKIKMKECFKANLYYDHDEGIILCYEFPKYLWRVASEISLPKGLTRRDVFVGTFVQATLHEVGHAVFDMLDIPVFGREEDAADQIAAFIMLNFGKEFAQHNLNGAARVFRAMNTPMSRTAFSDEHGTSAQRFYNTLCIAYGGEPDTFKNIVETGVLPKERASRCGREYDQVKFAFATTILPHIDQDLLKKVQSIEWAKWEGYIAEIERSGFVWGVVAIWFAVVVLFVMTTPTSPKQFIQEITSFGLRGFQGRLDINHWWAYMLTVSVVAYLFYYALMSFEVDFASPFSLRLIHAALGWVILVLLAYWSATFGIRRLHDRNKDSWLIIFWLAPLVFIGVIYAYPDAAENLWFACSWAISLLLWLWLLIEFGFRRGTRGDNRYGAETRYEDGTVQIFKK